MGIFFFVVWEVSFVVVIFMVCFGYWWFVKMIRKVVNNGEVFEVRVSDFEVWDRVLFYLFIGIVLLVVVLVILFLFYEEFV